MARLWSDIRGGGQYWYDLDSAPGFVSPGVGSVVIAGQIPIAVEPASVFRTPETATLTVNLLGPGLGVPISPNVGLLTSSGLIAGELRQATVTPSYPPDYADPVTFAPTILYIATITPNTAAVALSPLTLNVTQGGNILTVSPQKAELTLYGYQSTLIFSVIGVGGVSMDGYAPTLQTEITLLVPGADAPVVVGFAPTVEIGFVWRDVEAPPALTWA